MSLSRALSVSTMRDSFSHAGGGRVTRRSFRNFVRLLCTSLHGCASGLVVVPKSAAGEAVVLDYGVPPNLTGKFLFGDNLVAPRNQDGEGMSDLGAPTEAAVHLATALSGRGRGLSQINHGFAIVFFARGREFSLRMAGS